MNDQPKFEFDSIEVAESYDAGLVPFLFVPWAEALAEQHGPWESLSVLDLAAGTGVLSRRLGPRTGAQGLVVSADINAEMLKVAERNCQDSAGNHQFVCCSAESLICDDNSFDVVLCQQGFQFFPDKTAAAKEVNRVLKPGGKAIISTWLPVERCAYFVTICLTLEHIGEHWLSEKLRVPFDHMPREGLYASFRSAGFMHVEVTEYEKVFELPGGLDQAMSFIYSTPIAEDLRSFSPEQREYFEQEVAKRLEALEAPPNKFGMMSINELKAIV